MTASDPTDGGPVEAYPFPTTLRAQVVTPGARPRVHGYDVESDIASHYGFGESVLLALTGRSPDAATGRCFELAMVFLSPLAVTEAPTHAAVLARVCAGSASAVTATAGVALAEQARWILEQQAEYIEWLDGGCNGDVPLCARAADDDERQSVERLRRAVAAVAVDYLHAADLGRDAALLSLLYRCGLHTPEQMQVALVVARLATCVSEALANKRGALREYPMNLPAFAYEESPR